MRMSVMGQGRARVGCCSVAGTDCSAPAAILDAFLRLEEKGIVKPGESKKGLEMGILVPTGPSINCHPARAVSFRATTTTTDHEPDQRQVTTENLDPRTPSNRNVSSFKFQVSLMAPR